MAFTCGFCSCFLSILLCVNKRTQQGWGKCLSVRLFYQGSWVGFHGINTLIIQRSSLGFHFQGKCIKHIIISKFAECQKHSLRKPKLSISSHCRADAGLVQCWGYIFIFSSKKSLRRKYFLKCEWLHRCHLIEQDWQLKLKMFLYCRLRSRSSPASIRLWTFDVCAYLLSSPEHMVAFLRHCIHLWELYLKSLHTVPSIYIWAKPSARHVNTPSPTFLQQLSLPRWSSN